MLNRKLRDVAEIQAGYQARKRINELSQGKYRLIQGKDFDKYGNLLVDTISYFEPERKPELYMVKEDDLLLQSRGLTHNSYCIKVNLENTLAAGSFYILRLKSKIILPSYLCWWLNQAPVQEFFISLASGTIMSFVSKSAVSQTEIKIPDIETQQKIVNTIDTWRRLNSLQDQIRQKQEQLIQSLFIKKIYSSEENQ